MPSFSEIIQQPTFQVRLGVMTSAQFQGPKQLLSVEPKIFILTATISFITMGTPQADPLISVTRIWGFTDHANQPSASC